jgi:hypothetical protein
MVSLEQGQRYSIEMLPQEIESGRYEIILNGVKVALNRTNGVTYISMSDGAKIAGMSEVGYRRKVARIEEEEETELRTSFGGLQVWMNLEDVKKYFLTPQKKKAQKRNARVYDNDSGME